MRDHYSWDEAGKGVVDGPVIETTKDAVDHLNNCPYSFCCCLCDASLEKLNMVRSENG